jgi:hypothetical protein
MTIISQTGPIIAEGPTKLSVLRQNPPVGSAPPIANRARDKATQRVASIWHFLGPHRGDPTSTSFVSVSQSGDFFHTPPCGLASSHQGFLIRDYPRKSLETTWLEFDRGEGGISPCVVLWTRICPSWLSLVNSDPASTQILTQHYGTKSQTVS